MEGVIGTWLPLLLSTGITVAVIYFVVKAFKK